MAYSFIFLCHYSKNSISVFVQCCRTYLSRPGTFKSVDIDDKDEVLGQAYGYKFTKLDPDIEIVLFCTAYFARA